jgi:hypothetical protein
MSHSGPRHRLSRINRNVRSEVHSYAPRHDVANAVRFRTTVLALTSPRMHSMPFKNITAKQEAAFLSALRVGRYNLLLGAGFSMDSSNSMGSLPSGPGLLSEFAKATNARPTSLQRLYDLLSPMQIKSMVTDRFTGCTPGDTAKLMSSFVWRRVFTWNVDDVLENLYQGEGLLQRVVTKHFNDAYIDAQSLEELFVIHLHGFAREPERGYVFSREQYIAQTTKVNPWMAVLTQRMLSEPMIIAGSTLDEVDLDHYLALRTGESARDDRGPSILVELDDPVASKLCEKHGLLHFVGYSKEFFDYCKTVLPNPPTPTDLLPQAMRQLVSSGVSSSAAMSFDADFAVVPGVASPSTSSRFLYGHLPTWEDLAAERDIARPLVLDIVVEIQKRLADPSGFGRVLVLTDPPGTGKSTVLRRVAFDLARQGIRTLMCSAISRVANTTADVIDRIDGPVVVVIDNLAEQANTLPNLLDRLNKPDVIFIGAERAYRMSYLKRVLAGVKYDQIGKLPMSLVEARRLVDRYADAGAIGDHRILSQRAEFTLRIKDDPIAVACCRILNDFRPLDRVIDEMIDDASDEALNRYLGAALAQHCYNGGVRYEILISAFDAIGSKSQFEVNTPLPLDYSDDHKTFVVPENTTLGAMILERVAKDDPIRALSTFANLAEALAPWVNREAIKARLPEPRLSGRLFDFDAVVSTFLGANAEEFYTRVKSAWEWNSRYWEQVALLNLARYQSASTPAVALKHMEDAVTHARHAVAVEHHPFPLTTLGKVMLRRMTIPGQDMQESFDLAFKSLSEAIMIERNRARESAHPYEIIFDGVLAYVAARGQLSHQQLKRLREIVARAAEKFAGDQEMQQQVTRVGYVLR